MKTVYLGILTLASLAACGGGGGSSSTPQPLAAAPSSPAAPVGREVINTGIITGFSSVFVNNVKYEVESDTEVVVEGKGSFLGDDSQLKVGQKVTILASDVDGQRTATRIEYDDDLKGPVSDLNPDSLESGLGTFTVLQQTVVVDGNTLFDNDIGDNNVDGDIDIRDLDVNGNALVVEVSGLAISEGFLATRIERADEIAGQAGVVDDEYEVKGFIDSVADDGSDFSINGGVFIVSAGAGGTVFEDGLVADQTLVGLFVEVKVDQLGDGSWVAVRVKLENDYDDLDYNESIFEIEGVISAVDLSVTPNTVTIGSVTLEVDDASSLAALEGTLIELKGTYDSFGVLIITQTRIEAENNVRVYDRVARVDASEITTRLGIVVTPTGNSRVKDDVSDDDQSDHLTPEQFLQRVQPGDYLEARAYIDNSGSTLWTRIEREEEDDMDCRVRGPVESIEGDTAQDFTFVLQGVTVDVSQIFAQSDFQDVSGQGLGRQAFFDRLSVGDVVQATSDDDGLGCELARLTAREVEFEADDGLVGTAPIQGDSPNQAVGRVELIGLPSMVTVNTFELNGRTITVVGSTEIDDSIVEAALGREFDGDDVPFDQLPGGLTLIDLLPENVQIEVTVSGDDVAIKIEDL